MNVIENNYYNDVVTSEHLHSLIEIYNNIGDYQTDYEKSIWY